MESPIKQDISILGGAGTVNGISIHLSAHMICDISVVMDRNQLLSQGTIVSLLITSAEKSSRQNECTYFFQPLLFAITQECPKQAAVQMVQDGHQEEFVELESCRKLMQTVIVLLLIIDKKCAKGFISVHLAGQLPHTVDKLNKNR